MRISLVLAPCFVYTLVASILAAHVSWAKNPQANELVDAATVVPSLLVDLKYSSTDNFLKEDVYGDLSRCYLHPDAAQMLRKAAALLHSARPDLLLLAYDCHRPESVQRKMWQKVKDTPAQRYVANPHSAFGSIHNYGCAIDLTLANKDGTVVDMGSAFDFFGKLAQPRHEMDLYKRGQLNQAQLKNRLLLRWVMLEAGFVPIASEWWHFNCARPAEVRKRYRKID